MDAGINQFTSTPLSQYSFTKGMESRECILSDKCSVRRGDMCVGLIFHFEMNASEFCCCVIHPKL